MKNLSLKLSSIVVVFMFLILAYGSSENEEEKELPIIDLSNLTSQDFISLMGSKGFLEAKEEYDVGDLGIYTCYNNTTFYKDGTLKYEWGEKTDDKSVNRSYADYSEKGTWKVTEEWDLYGSKSGCVGSESYGLLKLKLNNGKENTVILHRYEHNGKYHIVECNNTEKYFAKNPNSVTCDALEDGVFIVEGYLE